MKRKRTVLLLALALVYSLAAAPALMLADDAASGAWEIREPVSPPPQEGELPKGQVLRHEIVRPATPPPPAVEEGLTTPVMAAPKNPPAFTPQELNGATAATPPPPDFPGYSSDGPVLRAKASPPSAPVDPSAPVIIMGPQLAPGEWRLTADRVIGQNDSKYIDAVGHAFIVKGTDSLRADFMRYYKETRWVYLRGHVRVIWEGDLVEAQEAEFDLVNRVGWLKKSKIFEGKAHLYFESENARKYAASSYRMRNVKVTGCDAAAPAWDVRAGTADLNLDGRTKLWNTVFDAKSVPLVYSPYLLLPGGVRRQSGLLPPDISRSKNRGYSINQPYYWVIDDEHDMTFFENAMSRRGFMQGFEFRHTDNPDTKGDWRLDFLNDRKTAKTESLEPDYLQGDGLVRPNSNRWWLRSKYNGFVYDPAWKLKIDLDVVSDQDYLREFESGLSGYDASRKNFLHDFGRDIDVADSLTRKSTAFLSRSWDRFGFAAKTTWTENLAYMNGNSPHSKDPTTQTLPELNFFVFKNRLPGTPFDFEAATQFDYFWRQYGTRGTRTDIHPTLSLPLPLGPFTFIPTVGMRNTAYGISSYSNESAATTTKKTPARTMFEAGFTGFTELSRVYSLTDKILEATSENVGKSQWGAIRHSIMPRVAFTYVPVPESQSRLPSFDSIDRLTRQNVITYSLTNVFDRRRTAIVASGQSNDTIPAAVNDYLDFFRLRLQQSYDRDEAARRTSLSTYPRRPFSDIMAEATLKPEKYVELTSRTYYSPYLGRPTEHENSLKLTKETLGELRFSYDYLYPLNEYKRQRTNNVQVITAGADYQITKKLKLTTDYSMDIAAHSDLQKSAGLEWKDQCYDVELRYIRKPSDTSFELRFNLLDFDKP